MLITLIFYWCRTRKLRRGSHREHGKYLILCEIQSLSKRILHLQAICQWTFAVGIRHRHEVHKFICQHSPPLMSCSTELLEQILPLLILIVSKVICCLTILETICCTIKGDLGSVFLKKRLVVMISYKYLMAFLIISR